MSLIRFSAIHDCMDFNVLKKNLNEKELEIADRLCVEHDEGKCICGDSREPYSGRCLAARWLDGCVSTQDFIEEVNEYG